MSTITLVLTEEERGKLEIVLGNWLKETRSEVRHTHTPDFRDELRREEEVIRGLLAKLNPSQVAKK